MILSKFASSMKWYQGVPGMLSTSIRSICPVDPNTGVVPEGVFLRALKVCVLVEHWCIFLSLFKGKMQCEI